MLHHVSWKECCKWGGMCLVDIEGWLLMCFFFLWQCVGDACFLLSLLSFSLSSLCVSLFLPLSLYLCSVLPLLPLHRPSSSAPSSSSSSFSSSQLGAWSWRGCRTVPVDPFRTKCLCDRISTFAILAQLSAEMVSATSRASQPLEEVERGKGNGPAHDISV